MNIIQQLVVRVAQSVSAAHAMHNALVDSRSSEAQGCLSSSLISAGRKNLPRIKDVVNESMRTVCAWTLANSGKVSVLGLLAVLPVSGENSYVSA